MAMDEEDERILKDLLAGCYRMEDMRLHLMPLGDRWYTSTNGTPDGVIRWGHWSSPSEALLALGRMPR